MQIVIVSRLLTRGASSNVFSATLLVLSLAVFACGETQVLSRRGRFNPEPLPRPDRIVVYDFDTAPTEVVLDPSIRREIARGRTPIDQARRQVALTVAEVLSQTLVDAILQLGLPAEWGYGAPVPKQGALIVDGQILRVDEGSRAKQTTVGFGAGKSELRAQVQVYKITDRGRRLIAEFETSTDGTMKPGTGEPVMVASAPDVAERAEENPAPTDAAGALPDVRADAERTGKKVAEVLAELFAHQGWIAEHRE